MTTDEKVLHSLLKMPKKQFEKAKKNPVIFDRILHKVIFGSPLKASGKH